MGIKLVIKTLIVYQFQKVSILLGQGKIFQLYCFLSRYLNGRWINQDPM